MSMIASVIGIVVLGIRKCFGAKLSPKAYYIILIVFLTTLIMPITIPSKISIYNLVNLESVKLNIITENDTVVDSSVSNPIRNDIMQSYISLKNNNWRSIIAYIWFIYFIISLILRMKDYIKNNIVIGNEKIEDERINLILEKCKKRLKIKRKIDLIRQDSVTTPAIMGIFHMKILISEKVMKLDEISLVDAFMHELSHYKRKDNIVNFIIIILKSIYGFNPFLMYMFQEIRNQMEYATDELAISKMNKIEKQNYCKLMLRVASDFSLELDEVLGMSSSMKYIEKRLNFILDGEKFEGKTKRIFVITVLLVLGIMLMFYPTSYGIFSEPKLYLGVDNMMFEVDKNYKNENKICIKEDSQMKVIVQNANPKTMVFCNKLNILTNKSENLLTNFNKNQISYFEYGDYIYTFTLTYGNGKKIEFPVRIVVE